MFAEGLYREFLMNFEHNLPFSRLITSIKLVWDVEFWGFKILEFLPFDVLIIRLIQIKKDETTEIPVKLGLLMVSFV